MALTNALLVRWSGGWIEVTSAAAPAGVEPGRREGFLQLGSVTSAAEAERVALAVLAQRDEPAVAVSSVVEPAGGDDPFIDFDVGDFITVPDEAGAPMAARVRSLGVSEDDMGNPVFEPELSSIHDEAEVRLQRWLKRLANGSLGGTVESATPTTVHVPPPPPDRYQEFPPFSLPGTLAISTSGAYRPSIHARIVRVSATLRSVGTTGTTVQVIRNGSVVATLTIAAGAVQASVDAAIDVIPTDLIQAAVTAAGTAASDLVVQLLYA